MTSPSWAVLTREQHKYFSQINDTDLSSANAPCACGVEVGVIVTIGSSVGSARVGLPQSDNHRTVRTVNRYFSPFCIQTSPPNPSRPNLFAQSWKSAIVCLGNMRKGGVAPGVAAYNVALRACASAGEFTQAETLLEDMKSSGATPDKTSFDALVAAADMASMLSEFDDNIHGK